MEEISTSNSFNLACELDRWLPFQSPKGKPKIDFFRLLAGFN